jgi:endonuclease/exonuclease/phosphatase (EEP) superfamily protein YafD
MVKPTENKTLKHWLGRGLTWGINVGAGMVAIATGLSLASSLWWGFSFLEYPRPQYCLLLLIALLVGLISHKSWEIKRWSLLWSLPLLVNGWLIAPVFLPPHRSTHPTITQPTRLRVLHVTFDHDNPDIRKVLAYVDGMEADIVSLLEVTPKSLQQFQAGLKNYQLAAAEPRENSHGSAWFVPRIATKSIQVRSTTTLYLPAYSPRPLLQITITWAGQDISLLCFHVTRPQSAGSVAFQQVEFGAAAEWSQTLLHSGQQAGKQALVVIGDYNMTPWAGPFRQFLHASGLVNSQQGFGLQPTWHSALPAILRIPIDHCLHSDSFTTLRRIIGPDVGSDHLPLFVELELNHVT